MKGTIALSRKEGILDGNALTDSFEKGGQQQWVGETKSGC